MNRAKDAIFVAQALLDELGADACRIAAERAAALVRDGDTTDAHFWSQVAAAARVLSASPRPQLPPARRRQIMVQDRQFRQSFKVSPNAYLLLTSDLVIADANPAYMKATMTTEEIRGYGLFEIFPDNPAAPEANAVLNLRGSLERVLRTGKADLMAVQRYDVRGLDGLFEERWWEPSNCPIPNDDGRPELILHHVRDVTAHASPAIRI